MRTAVQKAVEWGLDLPDEDSGDNIIAALDEYSMEMSMAFANWITDNGFWALHRQEGRTWFRIGDTTKTFSTKKLYSLFLSEQVINK